MAVDGAQISHRRNLDGDRRENRWRPCSDGRADDFDRDHGSLPRELCVAASWGEGLARSRFCNGIVEPRHRHRSGLSGERNSGHLRRTCDGAERYRDGVARTLDYQTARPCWLDMGVDPRKIVPNAELVAEAFSLA